MKTLKEFRQDGELVPHRAYESYQAVSTVGLITAHNPRGRYFGHRQNFESNGRLLEDIKSLGCPATTVRGMYEGHVEETFVITNITEEDIFRLAEKHNQEAVIWGYRREAEDHHFVMFYLENGRPIGRKVMNVTVEDVEDKEAFFSAIKAGKIKLPSFQPKKNAVADIGTGGLLMPSFED